MSWLLDTSVLTETRFIITWINILYFKLWNAPIWPNWEQVDEHTKWAYPYTKYIIDCTKFYSQRSPLSIKKTYFHYIIQMTYKGLTDYFSWWIGNLYQMPPKTSLFIVLCFTVTECFSLFSYWLYNALWYYLYPYYILWQYCLK